MRIVPISTDMSLFITRVSHIVHIPGFIYGKIETIELNLHYSSPFRIVLLMEKSIWFAYISDSKVPASVQSPSITS